jgi:MbtH protein
MHLMCGSQLSRLVYTEQMQPCEPDDVQNAGSLAVWLVLVNEDGLFSICEAHAAIPAGFRALGPSGTREECLSFIDENLTDMRPSYRGSGS